MNDYHAVFVYTPFSKIDAMPLAPALLKAICNQHGLKTTTLDYNIELQKDKEPAFAGEEVTFEDIKPYVSMYKGDDGKTVYDVLDKDEKSAFKTTDSKVAMAYLSKNFNKLRMGQEEREISQIMKYENKESLKESRTKIVEAIKATVDGHAQDIAGVEGEIERITQLANYQN